MHLRRDQIESPFERESAEAEIGGDPGGVEREHLGQTVAGLIGQQQPR